VGPDLEAPRRWISIQTAVHTLPTLPSPAPNHFWPPVPMHAIPGGHPLGRQLSSIANS